MKNIRKSLVLVALILFSALSVLSGCNDNIYKNLALSLSTSASNGVVTLSDNPQDNVFTITATTTGMPKGYDGAVDFSVPVNDSIELVQGATKLSNGVFYASFLAKEPGTVNVSVVTLEGNVSSEITIKVVKEISSLNFKDTLIPIVKGVETDISNFLNYLPQNTNQTEVELELIKQGANDELIKVIRNGSKITVPADCNVTDFEVVAKSIYKETVFARTQAKVITLVGTDQLSVKYDNGTAGETSDDKVLTYSRGEYFLELASNTDDLHEKNIYVDFLNPADAANYQVSVVGLTDDGTIVENGIKKGVVQIDIDKTTGVLTVKAIGLGTDKLILNVSRRDFPNYTEFTKQLIVNVNVSAYPSEIEVTDGTNVINELVVYANYDDVLFGAPIMFNVKNEFGVMNNENVIISLSGYEDRVELYDRWRNSLQFNTEQSANYLYYIKHTLTSVPSDLTLTVTSAKYNKITKTIPIRVVTQGINLTTDVGGKEGELSLDISVSDPTAVGISGLPNGYDYRNLTFDYDQTMINLIVTSSRISVTPKTEIGKTVLTITAPNGSRVRFTINLYESLDYETTNITIAGQLISPYELTNSDPINVTVRNNLTLPINFTINGKSYNALPDVLDYNAQSEHRDVVRVASNYRLATQNISGSSLVTITITGYDNFGVKTRVATFRLNISVHVPLSEITVATREVTIYDYNEINVEQKQTFGTHKIVLNTQPSYATYTFEDLEWLVNYNGISYNVKQLAELTISGSTYTYRLRTSNVTTITLVTDVNNYTQATIYCELGSTSSATFTVSARIKQNFVNESGVLIDATKQVDVKIDVIKPVAVEYFVFDNVETKVINNYYREYYVTFDERELGYTDAGYTTNNVKQINFEVYPQNALYKDLDVRSSVPSSIDVSINNKTGVLTITAKNKILSEYGTATITIWAKDSVNIVGGMGDLYTEITVRILNGTMYSPFEIASVDDLLKINQAMNAYYVLSDNISIGEWRPLGYVSDDVVVPFTGSLSGKNKTYDVNGNVLEERQYYLSNLQVTGSYSYMGLFAILGRTGVLEDLIVNGVYINNPAIIQSLNYYVGSIAGYSEGVIRNVTVTDLSGVDNFNGTYFANLDDTVVQNRGITIKPSTSMNGVTNVFVGGVVGFVNNPYLTETGNNAGLVSTRNESVGSYVYGNAEVNLLTSSGNTVAQIEDVAVSIEINVDAKTSVAYVGGVAGFNNKAIITKSHEAILSEGINESDVVVCINARVLTSQNENSAFGGVVGFNNGEVLNYNVKALIPSNKNIASNEHALNNVGGVIGYNAGRVENNTSNPLVRGNKNVGGLIGVSENTVVNLKTSEQNFVNGINILNNSDLVAFNKNLEIEYVTYSNLMVRKYRDEYNRDEVTLFDVLAEEFGIANIYSDENSPIRALFEQFANYYLDTDNGANREHMVILQVTNYNLNNGARPVVTNVYKSNNNAQNYRIIKSGNNISINSNVAIVSVQQVIETLHNAKVNYVTGNNVEFLETERLTDYKTSVLGYDNVGGLIGSYSGLYYQVPAANETRYLEEGGRGIIDRNLIYAVDSETNRPLTANLKIEFVNTLEYNSVYTYYSDATLINKWNSNVNNTEEYFGDIVLEQSSEKSNIGGLVGQSNNAYIQANSVNAGIAANNGNAGGIVGSVKNVIQIADSYFAGAIINYPFAATQEQKAQYGLLIGSAKFAQQTGLNYGEWADINNNNEWAIYNDGKVVDYDSADSFVHYFAPYAITSAYTNDVYFNNIANTYFYGNYNDNVDIDFVGDNISDYSSYKMLSNHLNPNASFRYFEDVIKSVNKLSFNNTNYLYYAFNTTSTILGLFKTNLSENDYYIPSGVFDGSLNVNAKIYELTLNATDSSEFAGYKDYFNYYELNVDNDDNGIDDSDQSDGIVSAYNKLNDHLWYSYADVNLGMPVLLAKSRVSGDEESYAVKLLVNFPPKSIKVSLNSNMANIWASKTNEYSTIYYYGLSSTNYDTNGNLNFGVSNLLSSQIASYTKMLNDEIKSYNTYTISDVLKYSSVPPFIGKDSFTITSSNSQVLSVERVGRNYKLVAKGTGVVSLTISSAYNSKLAINVTVNVVNAINNSELSYYTSGNKNIVDSGDEIIVSKSTESNQQTFILNSDLTGKYNFAFSRGVKTFNLNQNNASGMRYYYVAEKSFTIDEQNVNGYSVLHENRLIGSEELPQITINNKTFTEESLQVRTNSGFKRYYVYYIDVPTGSTTNIIGLNESNTKLMAVPYFVSVDAYGNESNTPTIKLTSYNVINDVTYEYGKASDYVLINGVPVAGIYTPDEVKLNDSNNYINYEDYINQFVKLFNVKVINSSYSVKTSVNTINFFVQQPISFYVDIKTDNKNAVLYLTYNGNNGEERTIAVSKVVGENLERNMEPLTINDLTLSLYGIDYSSFNDNNVTEKFIRYYFNLEVKDENKLNIQQAISKTYNFFIVKDNILVNYDITNTFVTSDLSEITLSSSSVNVTLNPQEIVNISLKHYPKGETNTTNGASGEQTTIGGLGEEAYDNIIPGYTGVLKINISPMFANFDEVVLTSSTSQGSVVWFNQVLANMVLNQAGEYVYDGTYSTIAGANDILGRIVLNKKSNRLPNGETNFDGFIYVKTLINSFVNESGEFILTAQAYKNGVALKSQTITLSVKTTPTLNLHVNGRDSAAVARGTSLTFSADHEGIEGEVDFSGSYAYRIINGVESMLGGYGSYFTISQNGNNYVLDTNLTLNSSAYICVKGTISKEINGEVYTKSDVLQIKVSDFVIDSITVENVNNGNFVGLFNQTYGLIVRINNYTCHPTLTSVVANQVKELEKQFSSVNNTLSTSGAWYTGNEQNHGTINLGTNQTNTFVFSKMSSAEFDGETIYTIRNIRFNSGDRLLARAMYCYTESGIKPILNPDDYRLYESNEFTYDRYFEFGFGFYRVRTEDNPDPIATVEEFKAMESGVDYILVSDLELNDWEPFDANLSINSLDGNGYVITINSFKLDEKPEDNNALTNKTFGIFTQINSETVIKNLIIEVKPNKELTYNHEAADKTNINGDLNIDATAYKNITFGLLAGVNYGMVTNVQVTNNADLLKIEREVTIARASADDPDYAQYWSDGIFDINDEIDFANNIIRQNNFNVSANKNEIDNKVVYTIAENKRDLSIVKVNTTITTDSQEHYMGVLVGKNDVSTTTSGTGMGYITNSSVDNITINGIGYVAGFAAYNAGKISTSYYKGANIINRAGESDSDNSATSGFVVFNTGSNASIQYCYVEGRAGDGDNFQLSVDEKFKTNSSNSDKTGLTESMKSGYAGYAYNHALDKDDSTKKPSDYNYNTAGLRAMNSAISSATEASAFVYENNAVVSNSYANILVKSSMKTSGFVFSNLEAGTIDSCFTLSSILVNNMDASPFTGRNSQYGYNNVTPDSITNSHYLKLGHQVGDSDTEKDNKDIFLDEGELATGIGAGEFDEYNTFQSFAFNTDFTLNSEKEVTRAVWFIPSRGTDAIYEGTFKHNFYSLSRPQLVAANLKTQSIRVWAGTETSEENKYNYVSTVVGEDISNPILVKSAENFNSYLNYDSSINDDERNFAIRLISDIAFNKTDLTANTYNMEYYGDLDGNGMNISELRLIADKDFEATNTDVEYLGLFGRIITKDKGSKNEQRGVVRNLNINVAEVKGSDVTYVGALAGEIQNANVFNVNITGDDVIQGRNIVGGLAGLVTGDSEIVNITSSLSAKAAYYKNPNLFKATNSQLSDSSYGVYEIYNRTEDNGELKIANAENISYAGGIIGIFDVDARPADEQNKRSLFNAKARSLEVNGNVSLVGEVVGGVFGLIGKDSTASEISFIVSDDTNPELIASRVAGGVVGENRGSLERALVSQTLDTQKKIDNQYKASAVGTGYKIVNSGYENLFSGNAHFIGGLVGFNNGGTITNAYAKVNVINIDSLYAGGLIGLSAGGKVNYAYSTASVKAFRGVGGIIGLHVETPVKFDEDTKQYQIPNIISNMFIDDVSAKTEVLPSSNTTLSNIVAANVWREEDLNTDRSVNYNGSSLMLGALIGNIYMTSMGDNTYNIGDAFANLESQGSRKNNNESIYFVQPLMNRPLGTVLGTKDNSNYNTNQSLLVPEIGAIGGSRDINNLKGGTNKINEDARGRGNNANYAGSSGVSVQTDINDNGTEKKYYYSRVQNIGSARTMLEIFETKLNPTDANVWGDDSISSGDAAVINNTDGIFANWSSDYWAGVRKGSDSDATAADNATAFPYLEAKAIKSRVLVYNATHLKQMETYRNAEFILQNDIDIGILDNWNAVGSLANPFEGSIHSQSKTDGGYYNFKIYDSKYSTDKSLKINPSGDYLGLLAVVEDANLHHFTLENISLSGQAIFAGSLFAYAKTKATVNEVVVNNVSINVTACTVGGMIGYGEGTTITNSLVKGTTINIINFVQNTPDKKELNSYNEKELYGFGGVAGMIDSEESDIVLANGVEVDSVTLTVGGTSVINANTSKEKAFINIGGVFGTVNPYNMSNIGIAGVNAKNVTITTNINFNGSDGSKFNEFNIGGLIGKSNHASLTSLVTEQENIDNAEIKDTYILGNSLTGSSQIVVTASNYNKLLNVGGAVGVINGDIKDIGLENITVESDMGTFISVTETNGNSNAETNVGGVAGLVEGYNVKGIKTNIQKINVTINQACETRVGGLIGVIGNSFGASNSVAKLSEIAVKSYDANNSKLTSVGGAFGIVDLNYDLTDYPNIVNGKVNKVVSNVNKITTTVYNTANSDFTTTRNVGGLIGTIYSGMVSECVSNSNIENTKISDYSRYNLGGLVGVIDIDFANKLNPFMKNETEVDESANYSYVLINNNYSTGYILDSGKLEPLKKDDGQANNGLIIGSINYEHNTRLINGTIENSSVAEILNNYTIGFYKGDYVFFNENKGGILGGITTSSSGTYVKSADSYNTYKNVTNIKLIENYYNQDFVPYSNNFGTALNTQKMLFESKSNFVSNLSDWNSDIWTIENNNYPLLKWIESSTASKFGTGTIAGTTFKYETDGSVIGKITDSKFLNPDIDDSNLIAYYPAKYLQEVGLKVKPATTYVASAQSVIFGDNYSGGNITDKVYYFTNEKGLNSNVSTVNDNSIIYGITTTGFKITKNEGFITKVNSKNNSLVTGENKGIIFNISGSSFAITNNTGIIDTLNSNSSITNNGGILNNVKLTGATITNNSGNVYSSVTTSGTDNKTIKLYSDVGNAYLFTVDANNNVTYSGTDISVNTNNGCFNLAQFLQLKGSEFDFEKIWTVIIPDDGRDKDKDIDNQILFNYGLPMLQIDLKTNMLNEKMDSKYYWANDNIVNETNTGASDYNRLNNLDYYLKNIYNSASITISTENDLAAVAAYSNYGYKVINKQKTDKSFEEYYEITVQRYGNDLVTKDYQFGILVETRQTLLNYNDKVLTLPVGTGDNEEVSLEFYNKLWTPIGFGADNISDDDLITTSESGTKYLNADLVGAKSYSNLFAGRISGSKYTFIGISAVGVNRNVGLFGSIEVPKDSNILAAFASDILIKDSSFISSSKNGGTSSTGTLAGFVYVNKAQQSYLTSKVGVENSNIYSNQIASGLVGKVVFANSSNNKLVIYRAYVNSSVYGETTSGLAYTYCGGSSSTDNAIFADEVYYVGELSNKTKLSITSAANDSFSKDSLFTGNANENSKSENVYAVNYYDKNAMSSPKDGNTCAQSITTDELGTGMLDGFDWISTWVRTMPGDYPTFSSKVEYWIKNYIRPDSDTAARGTINKSTKTITINPHPYKVIRYEDNKPVEKPINGPQQLAWLAYVVNNKGIDEEGYDYDHFNGWTINITGAMDFGGMVWTPIGYYSSDTINEPFQGSLIGVGTIEFENLMSTSVYVIDDHEKTGVKGLTNDSLGLVGYALNASVQDLNILSGIIYGGEKIGTLIGYAVDTEISGCSNGSNSETNKTFVGGYANVGGLVGQFKNTSTSRVLELENNTNRAVVQYSGNYETDTDVPENFGGIVGLADGNIRLLNNYNIKTVKGHTNVGGLAGKIINGAIIDCTGNLNDNNTGDISGFDNVGGIVGNIADIKSSVNGVTNNGTVSARKEASYVGGIAGSANGNITLAVNNGNVSAANSAGIVSKIESKDVYINNVLNNATANIGIAHTLPSGYEADMFGLCVTTTSNKPLGGSISDNPLTSVFNSNIKLNDVAFRYGAESNLDSVKVTYNDIINQNPYWSVSSGINLNYTTNNNSLSIATPSTITVEEVEYYRIDTEAKFNYMNLLIKTNFMNGSKSKVIKPIYLQGLNLSQGFTTLATNTAYPIKVNVSGTSVNVQNITVTTNSAKSILGYAYNNTIRDFTFTNKSGSDIDYKYADGIGALLIIGNNVTISGVRVGNTKYNTNSKFGVLASTLYGGVVSDCSIIGEIYAPNSNYIGGLVGLTYDNVRIVGCSNASKITQRNANGYVGGIVGLLGSSARIENCINEGDISGNTYIGGLVGYSKSTIAGNSNKSYNVGEISGESYVGGITGYSNGDISNNNNYGKIKGSSYVGGIAGKNDSTIHSCNVTNGAVIYGGSYIGGITGYSSGNVYLNNVTSNDSQKVFVISYNYSTSGTGGLAGYVTGGGSLANNNFSGYVGYGTESWFYTIKNVDNASGNYNTHTNNYSNGQTVSKSSITNFKFGTITGNKESGTYLYNNNITSTVATKFVDEYTKKYQKTESGGFLWCMTYGITNITVFKREVQIEEGIVGGYNFGSDNQMATKQTKVDISGWWQGGSINMTANKADYNDTADEGLVVGNAETVTVTYNFMVSSITNQTKTVVKGMTAQFISVDRANYILDGWYTDSSLTNIYDFNKTVESDFTLYAKWNVTNKYIVSFDLQGGAGTFNDIYVNPGKPIDEDDWPSQSPTKTGLNFMGWYKITYETAVAVWNNTSEKDKEGLTFNDLLENEKFTYDKKEDIDYSFKLYAYWSKAVVSFEVDDKIIETKNVDWNKKVTRPTDPVKTDWAFQYWATEDGIEYNFENPVLKDLTLHAVFSSSVVKVIYYKEDGTTIDTSYGSNGVSSLSTGAKLNKPTDPSKASYKFDGWYTMPYSQYKLSGSSKPYSDYKVSFPLTVDVDINIYQYFVTIPYTVKFVDESGASIGIANQTVHTGGNVSRPSDPVKEGYNFVGWYTSASGTENFIFSGNDNANLIMQNTTIYAHFKIKTFSVKFVNAGGGLINEVTVDWNTKVAKPVVDPDDPSGNGGIFRGWYTERKNDSLSGFDYDKKLFDFNTAIVENTTIWAYWESKETIYTISFVDSQGNLLADYEPLEQGFKTTVTRPESIPLDPIDNENIFVDWFTRPIGDLSEEEYLRDYKFNFNQEIRSNILIYGYWKKPKKVVELINGNGDLHYIGEIVKGEKIILNESLKVPNGPEGLEFKGWFTKSYDEFIADGNYSTYEEYVEHYGVNLDTFVVLTDLSLYAYFE